MADDINKFLNNNQQKSNKNPKFPDSSPTSSVFGRLGWNFTPSDPTILELSPAVKKHLQQMPKLVKDWQAEDMRSGTVDTQSYYVNPVGASSQSIVNTLKKIHDVIPTYKYVDAEGSGAVAYEACAVPELTGIFQTANVAQFEMEKFVAHTDRLSNKVKINPDTTNLPHYDQAMAIGRQLFYIVYQTDNIQNNAPILGTFTSLFIEPEIQYQSNVIASYPSIIANSISINISGEGGNYTSNLSASQIQAITSNLQLIKTYSETRRTHDENFWLNAQKITDEYQEMKMMYGGETQQKLINNYIGSDELKQKLVIKDIPQNPVYNISMAWDGTITYESNYDDIDSSVLPAVRTTPINGTVDYYEELPMKGNVVGDTYYVTTTGETWRWDGNKDRKSTRLNSSH